MNDKLKQAILELFTNPDTRSDGQNKWHSVELTLMGEGAYRVTFLETQDGIELVDVEDTMGE